MNSNELETSSYKSNNEATFAEHEALAAKAAKGDMDALASLCDKIAKDILFRTSRMFRRHSDAEEVAQESLFRVCKSIKHLKNPKAFRKWLGSIIIDEVRRKSSQIAFSVDNVINMSDISGIAITASVDDEFLPERFSSDAESRKIVIAAIDKLPQRQKEAIMLHYYDKLSLSETAEVLGTSQPTASLYLKEACVRIRSEIEASTENFLMIMHGSIAVPFSETLSNSLFEESVEFVPITQSWLPEVISKCGELSLFGVTAAGATVAASSSAATGVGVAATAAAAASTGTAVGVGVTAVAVSTAATVTKTVCALVAAAVVTLGVAAVSVSLIAPPQQSREVQNLAASGEIIFVGDGGFINPEGATPSSDSLMGELCVHHWDITTIDGNNILYTAESDKVEQSVFVQMREEGHRGEFELVFILEDANGVRYELAHNFFLLDQ